MRREMKCPLWKVVDEDRSSWLQHANAFIHPFETPVQIIALLQIVFILAVTIILAEIERRIGKHRIDLAVF